MFKIFQKRPLTLKLKLEIPIMAKMTQAEIDALATQITTNTATALANVQAVTNSTDDTALKAAVDAQTAALQPVS